MTKGIAKGAEEETLKLG